MSEEENLHDAVHELRIKSPDWSDDGLTYVGPPDSLSQAKAELAKVRADLERVRAKNKQLNARAQQAESVYSHLQKHIDGIGRRNGRSIARVLMGASLAEHNRAINEIAAVVGFNRDDWQTDNLSDLVATIARLTQRVAELEGEVGELREENKDLQENWDTACREVGEWWELLDPGHKMTRTAYTYEMRLAAVIKGEPRKMRDARREICNLKAELGQVRVAYAQRCGELEGIVQTAVNLLRKEASDERGVAKYESMTGAVACEKIADACDRLADQIAALNPPAPNYRQSTVNYQSSINPAIVDSSHTDTAPISDESVQAKPSAILNEMRDIVGPGYSDKYMEQLGGQDAEQGGEVG